MRAGAAVLRDAGAPPRPMLAESALLPSAQRSFAARLHLKSSDDVETLGA